MHAVTPDDVLSFWFESPPRDESDLMQKVARWFRGGEALDHEIVARFGEAVRAAVEGGLDDWRRTPRGTLALVLLLDQFTRNVFRDDPRMYAGDARAQQIALDAFDRGTADDLAYVERIFLAMPLLHAESLVLQDRSHAIARALAADPPPLYAPMTAQHLEQSAKYRDVIARFGRFPHRNALLGRESTPDELAFLTDWEHQRAPRGAPA